MNALEASKKTYMNKVKFVHEKTNEILDIIEKAIENREYECCIYESLNQNVKDHFEELGYKIEYKQCGINEYETVISWKNAE